MGTLFPAVINQVSCKTILHRLLHNQTFRKNAGWRHFCIELTFQPLGFYDSSLFRWKSHIIYVRSQTLTSWGTVPVDFHLTEAQVLSITRWTHSHIASLHTLNESQSGQCLYCRNYTNPKRKRTKVRKKEEHEWHVIPLRQGSATRGSRAACGSLSPLLWLPWV